MRLAGTLTDHQQVYSLDRLSPNRGYTKRNVALMHVKCNTRKQDMTIKQLFSWLRKILKHHVI